MKPNDIKCIRVFAEVKYVTDAPGQYFWISNTFKDITAMEMRDALYDNFFFHVLKAIRMEHDSPDDDWYQSLKEVILDTRVSEHDYSEKVNEEGLKLTNSIDFDGVPIANDMRFRMMDDLVRHHYWKVMEYYGIIDEIQREAP